MSTRPTGPGVSTFGGALHFPGVQMGFPAKITSAYSSTTGYSWQRYVLKQPNGVMAGTTPQTGRYAYAVDGSTTVALNTIVWLEPDSGGQGFVFSPAGGSSSISIEIDRGSTVYNIAADNTWEDTGHSITTSSSGYYQINAQVCMSGLSTVSVGMRARLVIDGTASALGWMRSRTAEANLETIPLNFAANIGASKEVKLQAYRETATWTQAAVFSNLGGGTSDSYLQLVKIGS